MRFRPTTWAFVAFTLANLPVSQAQTDDRARMRTTQGCWRIETGTFKAGKTGKVDPGQTILPPIILLDSVPGRSWLGDTVGFRVRSFVGSSGSHYADGYYTFPKPTRLTVTWSNGVVGMQLGLQYDTLVMRGTASAWTDYMTGEDATVTLRRSICP